MIAVSGHTMAQTAQPTHLAPSTGAMIPIAACVSLIAYTDGVGGTKLHTVAAAFAYAHVHNDFSHEETSFSS